MLYSVKMRAAQGAAHEQGGRHISGAERLVLEKELGETVTAMLKRARSHERGPADFINIKVHKLTANNIAVIPALQVVPLVNPTEINIARGYAANLLASFGVSQLAINAAFSHLTNLATSMRGALLLYAHNGLIVPEIDQHRGVRVSNMDAQNSQTYTSWLREQAIDNIHAHEAIILASKVAACPQILAELCWSDDPNYTIGYVANKKTYHRINSLKEAGSDIGGRIFFITEQAAIAAIVDYLQEQPVLIGV